MKTLFAKLFKKKSKKLPLPDLPPRKRGMSDRVTGVMQQMMQVQVMPGTAESVAMGVLMLESVASMRGWRVNIVGNLDGWKIMATTDQGEEITVEGVIIANTISEFVVKHARDVVMETIDTFRKSQASDE